MNQHITVSNNNSPIVLPAWEGSVGEKDPPSLEISSSNITKEHEQHLMKYESKRKVDRLLKICEFLKRFIPFVITIAASGVLINQGGICIAKYANCISKQLIN